MRASSRRLRAARGTVAVSSLACRRMHPFHELFQSAHWPVTAWHDVLTGALTRPHFLALLTEEKQHADDHGSAFALCLADVDALRSINDRWGHAAGDAVLTTVSNQLRALLSRAPWHELKCSYGRYDGDAIALLARGCDLERARLLAEELRRRIADWPLAEGVGVTLSVGVAQYRIGESLDDLLARLERTLHVAKQFGPDRVETSPTPAQTRQRAKVVPLRRR